MESSKDISEEKVIDNESKKSQSEVPEKPVSVAGIGTNVSAAPTVRETRKPPKKQTRRKNKDQE